MDRRTFTRSFIETVASFSLFQTVFSTNALSNAISVATSNWVKQLNEMSLDLKNGTITPLMWQENLEKLFNLLPPEELMAAINFEQLVAGFEYPDLGVHTKRSNFPGLTDIPDNLAFTRKVFGMKKNRAIIPHGHRNMASCHYVLKGEFLLKHYDKIEEDETHMIIMPTIEEVGKVGSHSSISDEKNNIHWLRATTDVAFTFDVIVVDLGGAKWEVDNIDPYEAETINGNLIRAPKLDVEEALEKYGHEMHH